MVDVGSGTFNLYFVSCVLLLECGLSNLSNAYVKVSSQAKFHIGHLNLEIYRKKSSMYKYSVVKIEWLFKFKIR